MAHLATREETIKLEAKIMQYEICIKDCKNKHYMIWLRFQHKKLLRKYQDLTGHPMKF